MRLELSTVVVNPIMHGVVLTINQATKKNAINKQFLDDFHQALDSIEVNEEIKFVIIEGKDGYFCSGMDFSELNGAGINGNTDVVKESQARFMSLMSRITEIGKLFIAEVDGTAMAGGVGIVAACDIVHATQRSQFTLSEALWGLLPCMVMPFLIRRVGFQFAYYMTATTLTMDAGKAHSVRLVDELSDNLPDARRKIGIRLGRLQTETIQNLKNYFLRMHPIPPETKTYAVNETTRLALSPGVLTNINNYVQHGAFPWESAR